MGPLPEPLPRSLNFQLLKLGAEHTYFVYEVTLPQVFHHSDEKQNLCGSELLIAAASLLAAEFPPALTLRRSATSSLRNPPSEIVFTLPSFLKNAFHPSVTYYSRRSIRCPQLFSFDALKKNLPLSSDSLGSGENFTIIVPFPRGMEHAILHQCCFKDVSLCLISTSLITIMPRNDFLCANLVWGCLGSLIPKIKSFLKFGEF